LEHPFAYYLLILAAVAQALAMLSWAYLTQPEAFLLWLVAAGTLSGCAILVGLASLVQMKQQCKESLISMENHLRVLRKDRI